MTGFILKFIAILVIMLLLVVIAVCWKNFKQIKKEALFIVLFSVLALVVQVVSTTLSWLKINNIWVLHLYTAGEFVLLYLFYYQVLHLDELKTRLNWPLLFLVAVFGFMVYSSIYIETINGFNPMSRTLECLIMIAFSVFFYIKEIRAIAYFESYDHRREGLLLINTGILLLFSGQFFIYLMSNYMFYEMHNSQSRILWIFNGLLNLLFYSILIVGIWKLASPKKNFSGLY
jgi:hypothetical protein